MADHRLLRHGWRSWLILYASWTIPVVMTTISFYAIQRTAGTAIPVYQLVLRQLYYYYLFASVCPAVYRLLVRYPFRRHAWLRAAAAHAVAATLVVLGVMAAGALVETLLGNRESFMQSLLTEFTTPRGQLGAFINFTYYVMVAGAMMIILLRRQWQEQEAQTASLALKTAQLETLVSRARLQALEMQINPHFLFNSLNSIASLVQQKRTDEAYRAIALLGDLLRETIRAGQGHTTSLEAELAFVARYLDLERMRFETRLQASVHVADGCHQAQVPAMILQPVVENAIRHAVSECTEPVQIRISASRRDGRLRLEVQDDGPGLPQGWSLESGAGVGLQNVRDRLAAHFGTTFDLRVEPVTPHGVSVLMEMPFQPAGSS